MTGKKTEKPNPTTLLMFVSRITMTGDKEGRLYYEVTERQLEDGDLGDEPLLQIILSTKGASKYMGGGAGIVYRVEQPPDNPNSFYTGTAQYVGTWPDKEQRTAWQMQDQTMGQKIALMKEAKKSKSYDAVLECLEPIREAYSRARGLQRNLILARAVKYITQG